MKQRNKGKKALSFGASMQYGALLLFAGQLVVPFSAFAEGSRDLYPANVSSAGYRHWLNARNTTSAAAFDPFPNRGIMRVYAKAGETIYLGSSVIGLKETDIGSVTLRGPDGRYL
jgi:hypothetical protein